MTGAIHISMALVTMLLLTGCRQLPETPQTQSGVAGKTAVSPEEDVKLYHELINLVLRDDLTKKDGSSRYVQPVLLLLPNRFRPGYVPSVPGIEVILGERANIGAYKTVVEIRSFRQTNYGFTVEVVHNPQMTLGASGSFYSLEKSTNGWRRVPSVPSKEKDKPFAWKS